MLNSFGVRVGHRSIANHYSTRNGWVVDMKGRHSQQGLVDDGDVFIATARLRYSEGIGVDTRDNDPSTPLFPGDYVELRGKIGYFMPLFGESVSGGPTFTAFTRKYRTPVSNGPGLGGGKDRHDVFFAPGAAVSFNDVCGRQCDVKFDYRYEHNNSNDPARDYENHVGGARIAVSF